MRWERRALELERAIRNHLEHSDCTARNVLYSVLSKETGKRTSARVFRGRKALIRWKEENPLQAVIDFFHGKTSIIEVWIEEETKNCYRISTGAWIWQKGEWFPKEAIEIVDWL
jgi:hypothetical protein